MIRANKYLFRAFITALLLFVSFTASFGQFSLSIKTDPLPNEFDTLNICAGTKVQFVALAKEILTPGSNYNVDTLFNDTTSLYTWYFGTDKQEFMQYDTVEYTFSSKIPQYVLLRVKDVFDTVRWAKVYIQVSINADFAGTAINTNQALCKGDNVVLSGGFKKRSDWKYAPQVKKFEPFPIEINNVLSYSSYILHNSFDIDRKFGKKGDSLVSVCVYLEHSSIRELKMQLRGPDSTLILLKDTGGFDAFFGEPIDDEASVNAGRQYKYCFTPGLGTEIINASIKDTIPEGYYLPEEDFTKLIGENMNGEWTLLINDTAALDNGFVFGWELNFIPAMFNPLWTHFSTYKATLNSWKGGIVSNTNVTTLIATDKPPLYGTNVYTFTVFDEIWGCPHSSSVSAMVEKPTFTVSARQAEAPVDIDFTNTTKWAVGFEWFLDNENGIDATTENPKFHYEEKGIYHTQLKARSVQGCVDISDTINIIITVPESKITSYNVFSPNNDGKNDIFTFEITAMKSLDGFIYNRWGHRVITWNSIEEAEAGWDGTLNNSGGLNAAEGVYYWVIRALGKDGVEHSLNGFFYLVR